MKISSKLLNRLLAALLAVIMAVVILPTDVLLAAAVPGDSTTDYYSVTVKDENGEYISGVNVSYSITVDGHEDLAVSNSTVSNSDGIVYITEITSALLQEAYDSDVKLRVTATKLGYEDGSVADEIINDVVGNTNVTITSIEKIEIPVSVKCGDNAIAGADVEFSGYTSENVTTGDDGTCTVSLYKGKEYSYTAKASGYIDKSAENLVFDSNQPLNISMDAKADDDSFVFTKSEPESSDVFEVKYAKSFVNTAKSDNRPDATVTYRIIRGENYVSLKSDATVTGIMPCADDAFAVIAAEIAEDDDYAAKQITYKIRVVKAEQNKPVFTTADSDEISYNYVDNTYSNEVKEDSEQSSKGSLVYYIASAVDSDNEAISDHSENYPVIDETTGKLTYKTAGKITVKAYYAENDYYNESAESEYVLTIKKADSDAPVFTSSAPVTVYDASDSTYTNALILSNVPSDIGLIVYSIVSAADINNNEIPADSDKYPSIDSNGKITYKTAGTVTVKAYFSGNDRYTESEESGYVLKINKADTDAPAFRNSNPTIVYSSSDMTYSNQVITASLPSGIGNIVYYIASAADSSNNPISSDSEYYPEIDANGNVTYKTAGTITVKAYYAANDNYKQSAESQYVLTIDKDTANKPVFSQTSPVIVYNYSNKTFDNALVTDSIQTDNKGTIVYSIASAVDANNNPIPAGSLDYPAIDVATGTVTYRIAGKITVKAYYSGNNNYGQSGTAEYVLTINKNTANAPVFGDSVPVITYKLSDKTYKNQLVSDSAQPDKGQIAYSIASATDSSGNIIPEGDINYPAIDANGTVTYKTAGTITVKAYCAGNGNYIQSAESGYVLTVNKDTANKPEFSQINPEIIYDYNNRTFTNTLTADSVQTDSKGDIVYSIYSVADINGEPIATDSADYPAIDAATGTVSYKTTGKITVRAYYSGNNNYAQSLLSDVGSKDVFAVSVAFSGSISTVVSVSSEVSVLLTEEEQSAISELSKTSAFSALHPHIEARKMRTKPKHKILFFIAIRSFRLHCRKFSAI